MSKFIIPFNSFNREYLYFKSGVNNAIKRVLNSGRYILGAECNGFEKELAKYLGVKYCVSVANGTEAITLALRANSIGLGDEVITTSVTAYPTIVGISETGAIPILVDVDLSTGLIDEDKIEQAITKRTKAILVVHLYGQSCNMSKVVKICHQYRLKLIEDCAQSIGTRWKGLIGGSIGDIACFSFYPTKNLGAYGDAGAIVTNNASTYTMLKMLRNYGQRDRYVHDEIGINSRLDEIQAAILRSKLPYLEKRIAKRRRVAKYYNECIKSVRHIVENRGSFHTYHLYVVAAKNRDNLMRFLLDNGIETLIHYPQPVYTQKAFISKTKYHLKNAEVFTSDILSIPLHPDLKDGEIQYVVDTLNKFS